MNILFSRIALNLWFDCEITLEFVPEPTSTNPRPPHYESEHFNVVIVTYTFQLSLFYETLNKYDSW